MMSIEINTKCMDICEKLSRKLAFFEEMLKITQELETKSPNQDLDLINMMLKERQELIDKIERVNNEVNSAYDKTIEVIQNENLQIEFEDFHFELLKTYISDDLYENIILLNVNLKNIIMQIQTLDERYRQDTETAREATKLEILRLKSILRQNQSYQKAKVAEPRFIDKKG